MTLSRSFSRTGGGSGGGGAPTGAAGGSLGGTYPNPTVIGPVDPAGATVLALIPVNGTAVSVGAVPAASGLIRMPKNQWLTARNSVNTADYLLIGTDGADNLNIGDYGPNNIVYRAGAGAAHFFRGGSGNNRATFNTISLLGSPLIGDAGEANSFHGISGTAAITPGAGPTRTEVVANWVMKRLVYAAGTGVATTVTMPTPANASNYYEKTIENNTGFNLTFTCGAGLQRTIATGFVQTLGFYANGDVKFCGAAVAP